MVLKAKKELLASKVSNLVSDTNENLLRVNLSKFFTDLEAEIQKALLEYYNDTFMLQGQINLILAPIHEKHQEYFELIMRHKLQEFKRAKQSANRVVKREQKRASLKAAKPVKIIANRDNLFGTLKYSEDRLANNTFTASQNTLNRVDGNINQILTDGYRSGKGINEVGRQITERFDQLRTWEANRIARTEIHTAQNMGIMSSYESLGVEYTQWIAASDDRTRDSHVEIDGEIIPMGETYSNGLQFPGDTSGPIEEWINCRCSNAPFVMPAGMMAPSFSPFKESDLVEIPVTEEPQTIEPTQEQLETNLTKQELEQYNWAKDVQTSEFISDTGKAKARETLEQLRQKALTGTPKPTSAPKPVEDDTTSIRTPKPKAEPKGKSVESMSSPELYESMTKADKKKYDKAKKTYENGKSVDFKPLIEKGLMEMRKLEQKQRDKLINKGKRKPKETIVHKNERTLDNIHKDIEVPTNELIPKLEKWIDKRCKNVAEFGYHFDIKTGKLIGEEQRGKKGQITMSDKGKEFGSIHSHPRNGMSVPSIQDLETFRCKKEQHHLMVSEHEVWYVKATDNFGIGGMGQQIDLQRAHKECQDRAFEKVSKEIKKGKIEATEEAIAEKLNEYTGEELLKTFNSPPWNKTLTVKRYYR